MFRPMLVSNCILVADGFVLQPPNDISYGDTGNKMDDRKESAVGRIVHVRLNVVVIILRLGDVH